MGGRRGRGTAGVASGVLNTARQAGSVIGVALFGSLAAADLAAGLRLACAVSPGLVLAVAGLAYFAGTPRGAG